MQFHPDLIGAQLHHDLDVYLLDIPIHLLGEYESTYYTIADDVKIYYIIYSWYAEEWHAIVNGNRVVIGDFDEFLKTPESEVNNTNALYFFRLCKKQVRNIRINSLTNETIV